MEISKTKSVCTASHDSLGREIANALCEFGIECKRKIVSPGAALGAGTRRNTANLSGRLSNRCKRIVRFRKLRKARVDTTRLIRTGAVKAITYGEAITGVPNTALLAQRRAWAGLTEKTQRRVLISCRRSRTRRGGGAALMPAI